MALFSKSKTKNTIIFFIIGSACLGFLFLYETWLPGKNKQPNLEKITDNKAVTGNKNSQHTNLYSKDDSEKIHCPEMEYGKSFKTLNSNGYSAYETENMGKIGYKIASVLIHIGGASQQDIILDIGTGYGDMALQFLKMGYKNIYANDISKNNIECVKQYIQNKYPNKKDIINFLPGDINSQEVIDSLPRNLKLVSIVNAINGFSADELDVLLSTLRQKIIIGGLVLFFVEPSGLPVHVLKAIDDEAESYKKLFMQNEKPEKFDIEKHYKIKTCDIKSYHEFKNIKTRFPLYPCNIETPLMTGKKKLVQRYSKVLLQLILEKYDFNTIFSDYSKTKNGLDYFWLIAQKC